MQNHPKSNRPTPNHPIRKDAIVIEMADRLGADDREAFEERAAIIVSFRQRCETPVAAADPRPGPRVARGSTVARRQPAAATLGSLRLWTLEVVTLPS